MTKKSSTASTIVNRSVTKPKVRKVAGKTGTRPRADRLQQELEQRNAELAIINSVQAALAAGLNIEGIYDAVGDKIREIFHQADMDIRIYDPQTDMIHYPYLYENGQRITVESEPLGDKGFQSHIIRTRETLVINENILNEAKKYGSYALPGTQMEKSIVMVPLVVGGQARGLISLSNMEHEHAFNDSDVRLLQTLANSMSVALENARLFDETQRLFKAEQERVAELQIINSIQQGLAAELDFQAIVDLVGDKLREVFNTGDLMITWYDEKANLVHYLYQYEHGKRIISPSYPPLSGGIYETEMKTRKPLVLNTAADFATINIEVLPGTDQSKSYVSVPIISSDRFIGDISLENYERENAFGESELRLLTTIAASLGTALENARLFDETQRLLKETEQRNAELAIINSVQAALAAELNIQGIYDAVGDKIREIFHQADVGIRILDPKTNLVHYPYHYENGERIAIESGPLGDKGIESHIIRTRETLVFNENLEAETAKYGSYTIPGTQTEKSAVYVPLVAGDQARGMINLIDMEREHAFSESDVRLLQTLANSMSVALENARLFDETQRLLKETEERNAELAIINGVQEGLASKLDMQAIYDLVGDKIRDIFDAQVVDIGLYDRDENVFHFPYQIERGVRFPDQPVPIDKFRQRVVETRKFWLINQDYIRIASEIEEETVLVGEEPKSLLFMPMLVGSEVTGIISLQNLDIENAFSDSDVRLLSTIAASMSIALENARLFNAEQQRVAELAAISTVTQALVAEAELDNMIQLVGGQMREIFEADIVYVALLDPQTNLIHFPYQVGETFDTLKLGEGLTSKIIETGDPLLINKDLNQRSLEIGATITGRDALSYLGVPIKAGGETIGVISVQSTTQEGIFDEDSVRLLTTIAANVGAAIRTAQLHAETQRRAREMATLAEVERDISSSLEASTVLEGIAKHARDLLKGDLSALFLPEKDGRTFRAIAADGKEAEQLRNDTINLGEGILGSIAKNKVGEIVNDTNADPRALTITGTEEIPEEHMIAVPLLASDELKGLMSVWRMGKGLEFTEFELEFLNNLARQAVVAIQNSQLFEEAREARAAAEQANAEKSSFLSNISHELRTPLTSVIGFTKTTLKDLETRIFPNVVSEDRKVSRAISQARESLGIIVSEGERLTSLINDLLDLAKIESGKVEWKSESLCVDEAIEHAILATTTLVDQKGLTLIREIEPDLPPVNGDRDRLIQVVINLLSNAVKFTPQGTIICRAQRDQNSIVVSVSDTGIGIAPEDQAKVFEKFKQVGDTLTDKPKGTGLGLPICREIIKHHSGRLWLESELGRGSVFSFSLPLTAPVSPGRE